MATPRAEGNASTNDPAPRGDSTPATVGPSLDTGATTPYAPAFAGLSPELADHPTYQIERELGRGGMGVVYLARNKLMDRPEVLKVMLGSLAGRDDLVQRFIKEIQLAARVQHPNIATAYAAVPVGTALILAMEYVDGLSLAEVVKRKGPLPVAHACHYARQVALGLQRAHEHGLVHRDIKPQNLMLTRRGEVKILDFGLAKVASEQGDSGLTGDNAMMGTPDYMPPEQATDARSADIRADLYSLGCTLFHLLTGKPPFSGRSPFEVMQAHQTQPPSSLAESRPDVEVELAELVRQLMSKRPEDRPATPGEVAKALLPFCRPPEKKAKATSIPPLPRPRTDLPSLPPLPPSPFDGTQLPPGRGLVALPPAEGAAPRPRPSRQRRPGPARWPVFVVAGVALVAGGMAVWLLKSPPGDPSRTEVKKGANDTAKPDGKGQPPELPRDPREAPAGARVLFDGKSLANWVSRKTGEAAEWRLLPGGVMEVLDGDIYTRERFAGRFKLHVEFRVPYEPKKSGQGRGNSGVYLQGRYEVQILDSEGVAVPGDKDCGALYGIAAPRVNACRAPRDWQSFDIEFTAPKQEPGGNTKPGRITVHHNGILIHDQVALPEQPSPLALDHSLTEPGPILLQNHGSPVQFRNLWLLVLTD